MSDGRRGSKTEDLMRRDLRIVKMSGVAFYFVCYRGDSVCSISESDTFRGQLSIWFACVVIVVSRVVLGSFL